MTAALKVLARAALLSAALTASFVHVQPAAAATPCWKTLLNDWYDGRIDQTYPRHCYTDALHHLPADVSTYSSAREDIQRALLSASAKKSGPNALIPAEAPASSMSTSTTTTTGTPAPATPAPTGPAGKSEDKGLTSLADKLNPGSATSLPVPLLVLGALALLLVAAGGAGLVVKRVQARRPPGV